MMSSEARKKIGRCVRRVRVLRGLSQEAAAALCDMEVRIYGKVERGVENYQMKTFERVLEGLMLTLDDFMEA